MMRAVSISFVERAALVHAEKHFPMKTQMRWQLIAEYVLKCIPVLSGKPNASPDTAATIPLMVLGNTSSSTIARFQPSSEMCRNAFSIISSSHPELLCYAQHQADVAFSDPSLSPFKPIILLPHVLHCCQKPVYIK